MVTVLDAASKARCVEIKSVNSSVKSTFDSSSEPLETLVEGKISTAVPRFGSPLFGDTVKKQTGAMAAALAGNNEKAVEWDGKSKEMIDANEKKVTNNKDLADFAHDNQLKK